MSAGYRANAPTAFCSGAKTSMQTLLYKFSLFSFQNFSRLVQPMLSSKMRRKTNPRLGCYPVRNTAVVALTEAVPSPWQREHCPVLMLGVGGLVPSHSSNGSKSKPDSAGPCDSGGEAASGPSPSLPWLQSVSLEELGSLGVTPCRVPFPVSQLWGPSAATSPRTGTADKMGLLPCTLQGLGAFPLLLPGQEIWYHRGANPES